MLTYLVNRFGKVVEADLSITERKKRLKSGLYRLASSEERRNFLHYQDEMADEELKRLGLMDVHLVSTIGNTDGYGMSGKSIKDYAINHGVYLNRKYRGQKVALVYHLPNAQTLTKSPIKIQYTMFETEKVPDFWKPYLKAADRLLTPCEFCTDVFTSESGRKAETVQLGYEPAFFEHIERKRTPEHVFTFYHYDAFKYRKGWDLIFTAFNEEFSADEPVQLVYKTTLYHTPPLFMYPKIKVIKGRVSGDEFMGLLEQADCFVFPSRGEGFGLTPLEAMATGLPAIIPNTMGMREYFNPEFNYGLDVVETKAIYDNVEFKGLDLGHYQTPTVESLKKAMRQAYNDYKAGKFSLEYSRKIAAYAQQFTIEKTAEKICAILKEYA